MCLAGQRQIDAAGGVSLQNEDLRRRRDRGNLGRGFCGFREAFCRKQLGRARFRRNLHCARLRRLGRVASRHRIGLRRSRAQINEDDRTDHHERADDDYRGPRERARRGRADRLREPDEYP